jgi:hypothetical protein
MRVATLDMATGRNGQARRLSTTTRHQSACLPALSTPHHLLRVLSFGPNAVPCLEYENW